MLVMLHQNPSTSDEYRPLIEAMASDRRVIAFDTPGYGMSDPPPRPLSIMDYAAAFSDAVDALGLDGGAPVDVYGYHTGALLAAELGLQRPDVVGRLVLSGVPMRSSQECADRLAAARASPVATDDGAALLAQSAALWRYVVTQRHPDVPLERAVAVFAEKNKPLQRGWWAYEGVWSYPARERLPMIVQPTMVLQPHDGLVDQSREACGLVSRGIFRELPNLSRDIFDVGADELAGALRAFLGADPTSF